MLEQNETTRTFGAVLGLLLSAFLWGLLAGVVVYVILWLVDLILSNGARTDVITDEHKKRAALAVGGIVALIVLVGGLT